MTVIATDTRIGCSDHPSLFQHPLLEEDPGAPVTIEQQARREVLLDRAAAVCTDCPLLESCLYHAVVERDIAGFVAGTTAEQRRQIRDLLEIRVRPDNLDSVTGVPPTGRQVNHAEIVRLRSQSPHMSLDTIAQRIGCSLSTVKRHLRQARTEVAARACGEVPDSPHPSLAEGLTARDRVSDRPGRSSGHAAGRAVRVRRPMERRAA